MVKQLICIVGPTGIGKTALSLAVAEYFGTEIISCDSRQFFKEMNIGTAVPTKEELNRVSHHFIQHLSVHDRYSVGQFERDALDVITALFKIHDVLVVVGGSGLYLKALLEGLDDFPDIDPALRDQLNLDLEEKGIQALQQRLKEIDPTTYEQIDIENPHRLIRALEVGLGTGKPYSSYLTAAKAERSFDSITIGLMADRKVIYERINSRVDQMMEAGLFEEAKRLYPYKDLNALNTVGYKELFEVIDNKRDIGEAIEEIKKNTRRFAKRQLTWYRKESDIHWFNHDSPYKDIIAFISEKTKKPT